MLAMVMGLRCNDLGERPWETGQRDSAKATVKQETAWPAAVEWKGQDIQKRPSLVSQEGGRGEEGL